MHPASGIRRLFLCLKPGSQPSLSLHAAEVSNRISSSSPWNSNSGSLAHLATDSQAAAASAVTSWRCMASRCKTGAPISQLSALALSVPAFSSSTLARSSVTSSAALQQLQRVTDEPHSSSSTWWLPLLASAGAFAACTTAAKAEQESPSRHPLAVLQQAAAGTSASPVADKAAPAAAPNAKGATANPAPPTGTPTPAKDLPTYTKEEVAKHRTVADRVWVTYKAGVYDVTEWLALHPGGAGKIMLAAGSAIDPFWAMYQQHAKPEVKNILEQYRIGWLEGGAPAAGDIKDPYAAEPDRHPALLSRSDKPANLETPASVLTANLITPTEMFYVRNHLPVPEVDISTYRLRIEGEGVRTLELTLEDLQTKFKKHTITATVQCAGNRRNEMKKLAPIKGLDWDQGAIGTSTFSGVRLRDVLTHAGLDSENPLGVNHIHFVGLDKDTTSGDTYGASIPVDKALSPSGDVLLAYEMNGQPLSKDHGYPLRAVVPGIVGARNVKWLGKVLASPEESQSHWQQKDYKSFNPKVDWDTVDWKSAPAIQEPPVTSAVCDPEPGTVISKADGEVTVRGYAWSGGGRGIVRVDVSVDGGKTWEVADLEQPGQQWNRVWAWSLWQATLRIPESATDSLTIQCKATDSSYNAQPDSVAPIWNLRGVVNNAWHTVLVPLGE